MNRDTQPRYVYFAIAGNMVKIGCSNQPEKRLTQVAEWVPFKVELAATMPGSFGLEAAIHHHFDEEWSHLEWFRLSLRLQAFIADVRAGRPVTIVDAADRWSNRRGAGIRAKKNLSRRVHFAEIGAHGRLLYPELAALRPRYAQEALNSYSGPQAVSPSVEAVEALERYIDELARLDRAPEQRSAA